MYLTVFVCMHARARPLQLLLHLYKCESAYIVVRFVIILLQISVHAHTTYQTYVGTQQMVGKTM